MNWFLIHHPFNHPRNTLRDRHSEPQAHTINHWIVVKCIKNRSVWFLIVFFYFSESTQSTPSSRVGSSLDRISLDPLAAPSSYHIDDNEEDEERHTMNNNHHVSSRYKKHLAWNQITRTSLSPRSRLAEYNRILEQTYGTYLFYSHPSTCS